MKREPKREAKGCLLQAKHDLDDANENKKEPCGHSVAELYETVSLINTDLNIKTRAAMLDAQKAVALLASAEDRFDKINTIAGVDQAFFNNKIISGMVFLDYTTMKEKDHVHAVKTLRFAYIPTLLSFREGEAILCAYAKPHEKAELLMIDGCGINHPRFAGLATHIGVALDIPTIGVSKNILCGTSEQPVDVGEFHPLIYNNKHTGWVLLSKENCNPIIIAPGHRVSLASSIEIVKHCLRGYKLPEPIRQAHNYVNTVKKEME